MDKKMGSYISDLKFSTISFNQNSSNMQTLSTISLSKENDDNPFFRNFIPDVYKPYFDQLDLYLLSLTCKQFYHLLFPSLPKLKFSYWLLAVERNYLNIFLFLGKSNFYFHIERPNPKFLTQILRDPKGIEQQKKWFIDHSDHYKDILMCAAVENQNLPLIQWGKNAMKSDGKWMFSFKGVTRTAFLVGNTDILKYLHENNCLSNDPYPSDFRIIMLAIDFGNLNTLKFWDTIMPIHADNHKSVPNTYFTQCCAATVERNNLDMLKYLREEKQFFWDKQVICSALDNNHFHILKYAIANNCPMDDSSLSFDWEHDRDFSTHNMDFSSFFLSKINAEQRSILYEIIKDSNYYPEKMKKWFLGSWCLGSNSNDSPPSTPLLTEGPKLPSVWDTPVPDTPITFPSEPETPTKNSQHHHHSVSEETIKKFHHTSALINAQLPNNMTIEITVTNNEVNSDTDDSLDESQDDSLSKDPVLIIFNSLNDDSDCSFFQIPQSVINENPNLINEMKQISNSHEQDSAQVETAIHNGENAKSAMKEIKRRKAGIKRNIRNSFSSSKFPKYQISMENVIELDMKLESSDEESEQSHSSDNDPPSPSPSPKKRSIDTQDYISNSSEKKPDSDGETTEPLAEDYESKNDPFYCNTSPYSPTSNQM